MDYTGWLVNMAPGFTFLFVLLLIWTLIWKGVALWKAARIGDKAWFIALLILNTFGILEIFYVFVFSKREISKPAGDTEENKAEDKKDKKESKKDK